MKWKTWQQEKATVKKQSNLITQDDVINVVRDARNDVGNFTYTT